MELNPQQTHETIFFILEPNDEPGIPVQVAFDDFDAAKAYLNRFRTYSDGQIVACHLNPGFYTDITKDCFFIRLNLEDDGHDIALANDLHRSGLAVKGHYYFEAQQICVYVMAVSETAALQEAFRIREEAYARREFITQCPVQSAGN